MVISMTLVRVGPVMRRTLALKGVMAVVAGKKGPRGCLAAHACHGGGKGKAAGRSGLAVGAVTAAKQGANARGLLQGERSR